MGVKDIFNQKCIFQSPYDQFKHRNGQSILVIREVAEDDPNYDVEVLPVYIVRFDDGFEIGAWPEEIKLDNIKVQSWTLTQ